MIRTGLLVLINLVLTLPSFLVLLFCMLFGLRNTFGVFGRWLMRVDCRVLGVKVVVSGREQLEASSPYVFMLNHTSFLDGPLFVTVTDRPLRAVVKRFVFRVPVLGPGMRWMGYVPLDKEGVGEGRARIARAAALIKEKRYSFLIFPEGTRSRQGDLLPFRRGGFFLALEAGVPIVPVTIRGTYELMPRGQRYVRKGTARVVLHAPIPVTGYSAENLPELMQRVRLAIASA